MSALIRGLIGIGSCGSGVAESARRVERLMREHDLRARHKRRFKATTDSKHALPVASNVLARDFAAGTQSRLDG